MAVLTLQVSASSDDNKEDQFGHTSFLTKTTYEIEGAEWGGWRFLNVTIPQGAVIQYAYLRLEASAANDPFHKLYGEDHDNPSTFLSTFPNPSFDISGRTRTTANVTWNATLAISAGTRFNSPDISNIIQEIVDRPGWSSGNAMVILADGQSGTRALRVRNYDNAAGDAAELVITYATDVDFTGTDGTLVLTGEAGSFDILPSTDLAGTDGTLELTGEAGSFDIATYVDYDVMHNFIANGGFETNTTGWSTMGTNTIARSTTRAFDGAASLEFTYGNNAVAAFYAITLRPKTYTWSCYIWLPASYDGGAIQVQVSDTTFVGVTGTIAADVNLGLRDQWQRVTVGPFAPVVSDLSGNLVVRITGAAPSAGAKFWIDAAQCEEGNAATTYLETNGAIASLSIDLLEFEGELGETDLFRWLEEPAGGLRADIYANDGTKLAVPPVLAMVASYEEELAGAGAFEIGVPASEPSATELTLGRRIKLFREGEGQVFDGIIRERFTTVDNAGNPSVTVRGPGAADDLIGTNLRFGNAKTNESPRDITDDLLALLPDGSWTSGTIGAPLNGIVSISAEGASVLAALRQVVDRGGLHLRLNQIQHLVDMLDLEEQLNRVFNGGFELSSLTGDEGWEDAISSSVVINLSTTEFYEGAQSAEVITLADGAYRGIIQAGSGSGQSRIFGMADGKTITMSFAIKVPNRCTNPGFEVNTTGWANFLGGSISRVTSNFHSGVASLEVVASAQLEGAGFTFTGVAGSRYAMRCWVYCANPVIVRMRNTDNIDQELDSADFNIPAGVWTEIYADLGAIDAHTTREAAIYLNQVGSETFLIDDVEIVEGTYSAYFSWHDETEATLGDSIVDFQPTTASWEEWELESAAAPVGVAYARVGVLRKTDMAATFYIDAVQAFVENDVIDTDLRFALLAAAIPDQSKEQPNIVPIETIRVTQQGSEIWNVIYPQGNGEGENALTLERSNRYQPYEILSETSDDGRVIFYLEDEASIAVHGRRQRSISDKRAVPAEASSTALTAASNMLYDGTVRALTAFKDPRYVYQVETGPFKHVESGDYRLQTGQRVWVEYRGVAENEDGVQIWLDVSERLFVTRFSRRLGSDGQDDWKLELAPKATDYNDPNKMLAKFMEEMWALHMEPRLVPGSAPTPPDPLPELPSETDFTYKVDLRRFFWLRRATMTFTITQGGGGAWGGTITINGVDRTTVLGGTFTSGTEYTINVRPYLNAFQNNSIVFSKGSAFTIVGNIESSGARF